MDDKLNKSLQKFLTENKRNRIENDGCACWTQILTDLPFFEGKQPRISVVFSRYQGNNINKTILMADATHAFGLVLAIPSYWLEVDQFLAQVYISNYVDGFINEYYGSGGGSGSGSGSSDDDDNASSWIHGNPVVIPQPTVPADCPIKPTPSQVTPKPLFPTPVPPIDLNTSSTPPMTSPRPLFSSPQTAGHGEVDQNISSFNKL